MCSEGKKTFKIRGIEVKKVKEITEVKEIIEVKNERYNSPEIKPKSRNRHSLRGIEVKSDITAQITSPKVKPKSPESLFIKLDLKNSIDKPVFVFRNFLLILIMVFVNITQGSFHQGDERFGESAGKQCTLFAIFYCFFTS